MIPPGTKSSDVEELAPLELAAWRGLLRITHRLRHELGSELTRRHALSMADYDALVTLAYEADGRLRMTRLAEAILQPPSSATRIIASLEDRGLVRRERSKDDARGTTAALTSEGRRTFTAAHRTHLAGVRAGFLDCLDPHQLHAMATAWEAIDPEVLEEQPPKQAP